MVWIEKRSIQKAYFDNFQEAEKWAQDIDQDICVQMSMMARKRVWEQELLRIKNK
ncbi:MAG: hypothetical protein R8K22_09200 [Mariprofundaceae bacterium]